MNNSSNRSWLSSYPLHWRHNGHASVSNYQLHDCLLNRLIRRRSKKIPKLLVTGLCVGNSPETGEFPDKWPLTRKMFPFDDVIMLYISCSPSSSGIFFILYIYISIYIYIYIYTDRITWSVWNFLPSNIHIISETVYHKGTEFSIYIYMICIVCMCISIRNE